MAEAIIAVAYHWCYQQMRKLVPELLASALWHFDEDADA
jgi:hypothetical protein